MLAPSKRRSSPPTGPTTLGTKSWPCSTSTPSSSTSTWRLASKNKTLFLLEN